MHMNTLLFIFVIMNIRDLPHMLVGNDIIYNILCVARFTNILFESLCI